MRVNAVFPSGEEVAWVFLTLISCVTSICRAAMIYEYSMILSIFIFQ